MISEPRQRTDMAQLLAQFHAREAALEAFRPLSISFPPEVVSLVQTCQCHPSQWEGWTSDGSAIYVRFRHGRLWVGLAPDYRHTAPTMLFVAQWPGDAGDDGYLRYDTLTRLTEGVVNWP